MLAQAAQQPGALGRESEPDSAAVFVRADALDQTEALEPVDVAGQSGGRDPFLRGELAQAQAWLLPDEPEERRLSPGDAELVGLLPELSAQPEHHRPKVVRQLERVYGNLANH